MSNARPKGYYWIATASYPDVKIAAYRYDARIEFWDPEEATWTGYCGPDYSQEDDDGIVVLAGPLESPPLPTPRPMTAAELVNHRMNARYVKLQKEHPNQNNRVRLAFEFPEGAEQLNLSADERTLLTQLQGAQTSPRDFPGTQ